MTLVMCLARAIPAVVPEGCVHHLLVSWHCAPEIVLPNAHPGHLRRGGCCGMCTCNAATVTLGFSPLVPAHQPGNSQFRLMSDVQYWHQPRMTSGY
mmetsp:Transcript_112502/g.216721  ORF Transcript_112502/g.216721 Transcript_112502/m.216721 type:complete len:96 (-) Transcript_112502:53-340(-)